MTLPPASANSSSILALTSGDAPQPQSSPKVMVPSATSESRTPDLPKSRYLMRFPRFLFVKESSVSLSVRLPVDRAFVKDPEASQADSLPLLGARPSWPGRDDGAIDGG